MTSARITLVKECAAMASIGVAVGLLANALSPRGLSLRRDYFSTGSAATAARPRAPAIRRLDHATVAALHADPRFIQERIAFIDARPAAPYASMHIPGAHSFDHYHPEATVGDVLAASTVADQVVVYCTGGTCEDSELAVADLIALGVPAAKLAIYAGGIAEWKARHAPLEAGPRNSGRSP